MIQDIEFPRRPPAGITHGWMVEALRELRMETERDAVRKRELITQLEACSGASSPL